nr:unnamed protein product [Spirometra erinaceieuropaei]
MPNGQCKDDAVSRIDAAHWVFSSLRKGLWIVRDLSIATMIRVYRASGRSVLLYGCECWALRVEHERKMEVFDHHCLRTILQVKFTDFVSNETVLAHCDNIAKITQTIQERRLRWFGNVLRRPPQELSVTALDPAPLPHWRRRRGATTSNTPRPILAPPSHAPTTTTATTNTTASSTADTDTADLSCPHCPRTFTSRIGLVGHLRIHRTETGEPVPGAPTYTHRTRLHCRHCPRTFTHRMGLFGHMRIHNDLR